MVGLYRHLVRLHQAGSLDFSQAATFNLDEYLGLPASHPQSFNHFMHENFLRHINIQPRNIHIPDGTIPPETVNDYCQQYEKNIVDAGGIDLQLLGIGRTGHVGFNEPGSARDSRTRLITLDRVTRMDAASKDSGGRGNSLKFPLTTSLSLTYRSLTEPRILAGHDETAGEAHCCRTTSLHRHP